MAGRGSSISLVGRVVALLGLVGGCGDEGERSSVASERCVIRLHGKGGGGSATRLVDGIAEVRPTGNAEGWGGRQWLYFPEEEFARAKAVVMNGIDEAGCRRAVVTGFSNGGAFAAKLYCRAETFGGRVVGYVVDDPVPDAATSGCQPATDVEATLYWTGALADDAPAGTQCDAIDWTCEGGAVVGIDAFAAALGVPATPSPFTDHQPYDAAPELGAWLN